MHLEEVKKQLLETYKALQPENGNEFSPREGYYLILSVYEVSGNKMPVIPRAKVLWKKEATDSFLEGTELEIQLISLYDHSALGPKLEYEKEDLVGKVLHILRTFTVPYEFEGREYQVINVCWSVDNNNHEVVSDKKINFFDVLSDSQTAVDAVEITNKSLSEDQIAAMDVPQDPFYVVEDPDDLDNLDDFYSPGDFPDDSNDNTEDPEDLGDPEE